MKFIASIVLSLVSLSALAFGNTDVTQLLAAGMGEDIVLSAIANAAPATFDTSATGLIGLKNAGASPAIIQKIIARQGANNATTAMGSRGNGGPCQLESSNMEYKAPVRADGKIVGLVSNKYDLDNNINIGRAVLTAATRGLVSTTGTQSVVVPGGRAATRISDKTPEFLDLFELPDRAPQDRTFLLRLTAQDASRTVTSTAVSVGVLGGKQTMGFPDDVVVPVSIERVEGICTWNSTPVAHFRMKPSAPLASGEYALFIGNKVFDFGVD